MLRWGSCATISTLRLAHWIRRMMFQQARRRISGGKMHESWPGGTGHSRLPPGTRLNGIFETDQAFATGDMAEIYRRDAIETNDPVAIKVLRAELADNPMALALLRKEASA